MTMQRRISRPIRSNHVISQTNQVKHLTLSGGNPTLYILRSGGNANRRNIVSSSNVTGTLLLPNGSRVELTPSHSCSNEVLTEANLIYQSMKLIQPNQSLKVDGCIQLKTIPKECYDRLDNEEIKLAITSKNIIL